MLFDAGRNEIRGALEDFRSTAKSKGHSGQSIKKPWCKIKAILSLLLSPIWICRYQLLASNVEEMISLPAWLIHSPILEIGTNLVR